MTDSRRGFLKGIRNRIRLAWLAWAAQQYAPFLGLALVAVFLLDWLTSFDRPVVVASILIAGFVAALVIGAISLRISDWDASRAAERGLGARDVLTTALEFSDQDDELHHLIQRKADELVARSKVAEAIPIHSQPRRMRQLALAAALAAAVGLLPPLGSTPALSADHRTQLETEAEKVEKIAEAVEESGVEGAEDLADQLRDLAEELRRVERLEDALAALERADTRLQALIDPQFLAQKAAVQGLAQDLALRPLTPQASPDAAAQFEDLAEELDQLSDPEREALIDRLRDLAESQAAGNPTLSDQLSRAANALAQGDLVGASRSLQDAAAGQRSGLSQARGQQAIAETQRALDGVRARLGGQGQGEGQGQGQGEGQGQGQGGQGGQGGQAGGGGSGQISGVAPGQGGASGQGGQGSVGPGTGQHHGTGVDTASIFDPIDPGSMSDLVQVGIDGGTGEGDIIGRGDAPTQRGESIVPYAQVLPHYLNEAADALGQLRLPPSMRDIVRNYFDQLANEAR